MELISMNFTGANVMNNYDKALMEWNNIRRQYGLEPENIPPYQNSGFNIKLPDGSNVNGQFYYGGITNPNGYTIKINYSPPTINKIPPVYIRYKID